MVTLLKAVGLEQITCKNIYEGESNENLKYFLSHNLLNTKVHNDIIFLRSLHCVPYKCSSALEVHRYL